MSDTQASIADSAALDDDISSKLEDALVELLENVALTPEEIEAILAKLEDEVTK